MSKPGFGAVLKSWWEQLGGAIFCNALKTFWSHFSDWVFRVLGWAQVFEVPGNTGNVYHDLATVNGKVFKQNSMSYLRVRRHRKVEDPKLFTIKSSNQHAMGYQVAWLMDRIGLDTGPYLEEVTKVKGKLDEHMQNRGPWQRAMFAEYYDRFGLEKVPYVLHRTARLDCASSSSQLTFVLGHDPTLILSAPVFARQACSVIFDKNPNWTRGQK
eukprot:SAG31_NODE_471_length_15238_cov_14.684554_8_plen_213_part_00